MRKSFIAAESSFILLISVSNILFVLVCVIASLFLHSGYGIISSEQVKRMSAPSAGDGETAAGVLHVKITGQSVVIFGDDDNGNSDYITVKKGSEYRYISEKTTVLNAASGRRRTSLLRKYLSKLSPSSIFPIPENAMNPEIMKKSSTM